MGLFPDSSGLGAHRSLVSDSQPELSAWCGYTLAANRARAETAAFVLGHQSPCYIRRFSREHLWLRTCDISLAQSPENAHSESSNTKDLTSRCSRRLAGLFPPMFMIKTLAEIASRALAS